MALLWGLGRLLWRRGLWVNKIRPLDACDNVSIEEGYHDAKYEASGQTKARRRMDLSMSPGMLGRGESHSLGSPGVWPG